MLLLVVKLVAVFVLKIIVSESKDEVSESESNKIVVNNWQEGVIEGNNEIGNKS